MKAMTHTQYVHWLLHKDEEAAPGKDQPVNKASGRANARCLTSTPISAKNPKSNRAEPKNDPQWLQTIRALSIRQPYAGLIMAGIKNVENRSWFTNYVGPLAIVSTQKPEAAEYWGGERELCKKLGVEFPETLCKVNGSILGVVDFNYLVYNDENDHTVTDHPTLTLDQVEDWWNGGIYGFILEYPRVLPTPIPLSGKLGLYKLATDVIERIEEQLTIASGKG